MRLNLLGHSYKYAVEQIMLSLFPDERPEYGEGPGNSAVVSLSAGVKYTTAHTRLAVGDQTADGYSRVIIPALSEKLAHDRECQRIVKLSFYRAAVKLTGYKPDWGALTGIRPAKIVTRLLEQGYTDALCDTYLKKNYYVSPLRRGLTIACAKASLELKSTLEPRDVSIYVGIPFCPTRCAYCNFVSNSVEKTGELVSPFLEALHREIDETAGAIAPLNLRVVSLYFGGGTPTTLSAGELAKLIAHLRRAFGLSDLREFTVEAGRPDTIDPEKLAALREGGVTRISINPQTMRDEVLEAIGRGHSAGDVLRAYRQARDAGFGDINMDLIAGLPADSARGFARSLNEVLALDPENITVHTLAMKKGSRLSLEQLERPGADEVEKMLDGAYFSLEKNGYRPYYMYRQKFMAGSFENTGWSKPGFTGIYNICMMEELHSIISLGGGGVTKLVFPHSGRIERIFNYKYPLEYINGSERLAADKLRMAKLLSELRVIAD